MVDLLTRIFRKKDKVVSSDEDTIPIKKVEKDLGLEEVTKPLSPLIKPKPVVDVFDRKKDDQPNQLMAGWAQSVGKQRTKNEDSMFCLTTILSGNGGVEPLGLYIVADGMGGHQKGEVASEIAIRIMAEHIIQNLITNLISIDPHPPEESLQEMMNFGIQKAHESIQEQAEGGGTTLTTVALFSNQMTIAHVGDSRIYWIGLDGKMSPLTRDHSLVKRLEELGQLTSEEAALDPRRNVLYHALGQGTPLEPEIISAPIPPSGYLLVCSDGLWGVISEEEITKIVNRNKSIHKACQDLINAANTAGGPDNITAILIKLPNYSDA